MLQKWESMFLEQNNFVPKQKYKNNFISKNNFKLTSMNILSAILLGITYPLYRWRLKREMKKKLEKS